MTNYEKYENRIPEWTLKSLQNYIESGIPAGGFLESVLSDSLFGAFNQADSDNREALHDIVMFIYNEAPADCFGSKEHVSEWVLRGGLKVEVADV